jgi:hypothetical protein
MMITRAFTSAGLLLALLLSTAAHPAKSTMNSWRGITPLQSSVEDVARVLGIEADQETATVSGPFAVPDGEVTFSYLTPSLAKIYRAPRAMVGKVFTIQFRPERTIPRAELKLPAGFKRCVEEMSKMFYYLVNDLGVAYQLNSRSDEVETIIYQPSRADIRRLSVNTECVF